MFCRDFCKFVRLVLWVYKDSKAQSDEIVSDLMSFGINLTLASALENRKLVEMNATNKYELWKQTLNSPNHKEIYLT